MKTYEVFKTVSLVYQIEAENEQQAEELAKNYGFNEAVEMYTDFVEVQS
jgi:hypothetical protein